MSCVLNITAMSSCKFDGARCFLGPFSKVGSALRSVCCNEQQHLQQSFIIIYLTKCNPEQLVYVCDCNPEQLVYVCDCSPEQLVYVCDCNPEQLVYVCDCSPEQLVYVCDCSP